MPEFATSRTGAATRHARLRGRSRPHRAPERQDVNEAPIGAMERPPMPAGGPSIRRERRNTHRSAPCRRGPATTGVRGVAARIGSSPCSRRPLQCRARCLRYPSATPPVAMSICGRRRRQSSVVIGSRNPRSATSRRNRRYPIVSILYANCCAVGRARTPSTPTGTLDQAVRPERVVPGVACARPPQGLRVPRERITRNRPFLVDPQNDPIPPQRYPRPFVRGMMRARGRLQPGQERQGPRTAAL